MNPIRDIGQAIHNQAVKIERAGFPIPHVVKATLPVTLGFLLGVGTGAIEGLPMGAEAAIAMATIRGAEGASAGAKWALLAGLFL